MTGNDPIPFKKEEVFSQTLLFEIGIAVVICVLVILVIALLLKKFHYGTVVMSKTDKHIEVVEKKRITPKLTLFMVKWEGENILFAQSGDQMTVLMTKNEEK